MADDNVPGIQLNKCSMLCDNQVTMGVELVRDLIWALLRIPTYVATPSLQTMSGSAKPIP